MRTNTEELKAFFNKNKVTQQKLAAELGCNQSFVSDFLNGKKPIPDNILLQISDNYKISMEWLVTGKGDMMKGESNSECTEISISHSLFEYLTNLTNTVREQAEEIGLLKAQIQQLTQSAD